MAEYEPIELKAYYRAPTHLPIWEVIDKAGIWRQVDVESVSMQFCMHPSDAEAALFDGSVDFVSGNHITPYALIAQGKPIVCLTSPSNGVRAKLVTRKKISEVSELRGMCIADRALEGRLSGFSHPRGNHMLYVEDAGLDLDKDVTWLEIGTDPSPEVRAATLDAMKHGDADATFLGGNAEVYEEAGFNVLHLDLLPMINGPTLTTAYPALQRKDRLGERMVKAVVMGIHYAKAHREERRRARNMSYGRWAEPSLRLGLLVEEVLRLSGRRGSRMTSLPRVESDLSAGSRPHAGIARDTLVAVLRTVTH